MPPRKRFAKKSLCLIALACLLPALLVGCGAAPAAIPPTESPRPTETTTPARVATATALASVTASPTPSPTTPPPSPTPSGPLVCSPLGGYALEEMAGMVVNVYNPPRLGSDDPHQGVDVAYRDPSLGMALGGTPVLAVLGGQAVLVVNDRFPYGSALMVETPLEDLPPGLVKALALPAPAQDVTPNPALTCPESAEVVIPDNEARSLYVLYAHMQAPPALAIGQAVACGQQIGVTGSSGNALNPHLHIEIRVGPAGMRFAGMAHYDASASAAEMRAYCAWRISGAFQTIDPLAALSALTLSPGQ